MATIATSIQIYDKVSRPINSMISAIGSLCDAFDSAERSMEGTFNTVAIDEARKAIERTALEVIQLGQDTGTAENKQEQYNKAVRKGSSAMDGLVSKVGGLIGAYASIQTIGAVLNISDEMTQTNARLGLIVGSQEEVLALQEQIFQAAQRSRGSYQDMASTVAKLGLVAGDAFSGTDEIVRFTELLNKQLVVGGASATEQAAAMYQLTQAMSSGRLQGDEYRSIIENAPLLAKAIEDYMINVQGATGTMKDWAAEGLLTADVIKAAMFNSADEVEQRFNQIPMTWNQIWTSIKNNALKTFQPILKKINDIANSPKFQKFISNLTKALAVMADVLLWIVERVCDVAEFISDNWAFIEPLVWGIVWALVAYKVALGIINIIVGISSVLNGLQATSLGMVEWATYLATGAQYGYNTALYACPLVWIIALIVLLIVVVYYLCDSIAKLTGVTETGFGLICGIVMAAVAFIWNLIAGLINGILELIWVFVDIFGGIFEWVLNACTGGFDSFGGAVANLIGQIISWFLSLGQVVTSIIDAIFGTDWTSGLQSLKEDVTSWGKTEDAITIDREAPKLDRLEYGKMFDMGAEWGDGIAGSISDIFSGSDFDPTQYDPTQYDDLMPKDIEQIASDTGAMADSMEISSEDLKYLRDIAERDVINRFTTAEIKVDMTNNNNVSSNMDLDGIVDYLVVGVNEAMVTAAEGVHS